MSSCFFIGICCAGVIGVTTCLLLHSALTCHKSYKRRHSNSGDGDDIDDGQKVNRNGCDMCVHDFDDHADIDDQSCSFQSIQASYVQLGSRFQCSMLSRPVALPHHWQHGRPWKAMLICPTFQRQPWALM